MRAAGRSQPPRRRRRREARREEPQDTSDLPGRDRGQRGRRMLGRSVGSAEVDRRDEEEAGRSHPAAARGQALRELHLRREQHAFAVPAGGGDARGAGPAPERAPQPRVPGRILTRHAEDGGHLQGGHPLLWPGAVEGRPGAQGAAWQLPRAERRQDHGHHPEQDQSRRDRSGRTRRLHRAARIPGSERLMRISEKKRMSRFQIRTAAGALALVALSVLTGAAHAADPTKLESIDVQTSGQQVQLKIHMSGPAPEPLPFTIDKPARIAFDLPNTTLALASRRIDVRSGGVDTVVAAEANGRTRLVVNVDALMPYTTQVDGNNLIVMLGRQPGAVTASAGTGSRASAAAASVERAIKTIDFRRGSDGTGRIIVQLSDPRTPVNVRQEGNQVVVDFAGTMLPKNLMRRYDVTDFATPVQTVDALRVEDSSRLVISAQGEFEQLAYQSDTQYTVEIKAAAKP